MIYQYHTSITNHDAISNNVFDIYRMLEKHHYECKIFADQTNYSGPLKVYKTEQILKKITKDDLLLMHFGIGADLFDELNELPCKIVMIYHNITPPKYFSAKDGDYAREAQRGLRQLNQIVDKVHCAIAVSDFNAKDLIKYGYKNIEVIPIVKDFNSMPKDENNSLRKDMKNTTNILFVGRLSPQKCQNDIVKTFYFYQKYYNSDSRLYIVGGYGSEEEFYLNVKNVIEKLKLEDKVILTGKVSDKDLVTYYKNSNLFLSMSEHEGFSVPALECMYYGVPVLAYYFGGALPDTVGTGAVYFTKKDYFEIAGIMDHLINDKELKQKLVLNEKKELERFDPKKVEDNFIKIINGILK